MDSTEEYEVKNQVAEEIIRGQLSKWMSDDQEMKWVWLQSNGGCVCVDLYIFFIFSYKLSTSQHQKSVCAHVTSPHTDPGPPNLSQIATEC